MTYNLKTIRKQFKENGVFYTQKETAIFLRSFLPEDVQEVYDPTCGNGGLLSVFGDDVKKYGQELDADQAQNARDNLVNCEIVTGNTLTNPAFMDRRFDWILANPPFSIKWDQQPNDERFNVAPALAPKSKADYAFVLHCLHLLSDTGKAVIVEFPGILYRGSAEGKIRQWLIEKNYIEQVIHIPGKRFVDTQIATCVLVLSKCKTTTDIVFHDSEHDLMRAVPFDEVKENGFNLSVQSYVRPPEPPKEVIDPIKLDDEAIDKLLLYIESSLNISRVICELEGLDFLKKLDKVQSFLTKYRNNYLVSSFKLEA